MKSFLRILGGVIVVILIAIALIIWVPAQRTSAKALDLPTSDITAARGAYVARAANCEDCHTGPGRKAYSGGLTVASPFGTIYSTNITPDKQYGIGDYSLDDFRAALYDGVRKNGTRLYPAMPYENYRLLSEADVESLYRYYMDEVKPVHDQPPQTHLAFPFNQRLGVRVWDWLALKNPRFKPPTDNPQINRGAYLVQALGHCAACHSPRNWLMASNGIRDEDAKYLTGGKVDGRAVPPLRGKDSVTTRWSQTQIAQYLATGRNAYTGAAGDMTSVVGNSLQHLSYDDIMAMSAYLKYLDAGTTEASAHSNDVPTKTQAMLTAANPSTPLGARLYLDNCDGCHFANGLGAPGVFPTLDGNPTVTAASATSLIETILYGAAMPSTQLRPERFRMPGFAWRLDDHDVATLATFLRQGWNNHASAVTAGQVAALRHKEAKPPLKSDERNAGRADQARAGR
jgi:mono/diheme cytochrome c family protein